MSAQTVSFSTPGATSTDSGRASSFKPAIRVQNSLLTPLEQRCLQWLVTRLPGWVTSDQLTVLGFAAMLAAAAFYLVASKWISGLWFVNVCLAINWFGDSLDGTLARARNKQRPRYGYYVDHVIDALGILFIVCGMAGSGLMSWPVALAVLVTYYLLSIDVYLATHSLGLFRMSFLKFGPTELRLLLVIGNIKVMIKPTARLFSHSWLVFDLGAIVAIGLMALIIVRSIVRNTIALYRAEPL
jgi:archaetidylinositol phosphate synthase